MQHTTTRRFARIGTLALALGLAVAVAPGLALQAQATSWISYTGKPGGLVGGGVACIQGGSIPEITVFYPQVQSTNGQKQVAMVVHQLQQLVQQPNGSYAWKAILTVGDSYYTGSAAEFRMQSISMRYVAGTFRVRTAIGWIDASGRQVASAVVQLDHVNSTVIFGAFPNTSEVAASCTYYGR
ncbi:MAG TPA: hypothetical protein VIZ22_14780 [Candidatus Limnocylindrales bacterium]